jgi:hypothetical protein
VTETLIRSGALSRPVARFVAIGLFLMAFFTVLWALWSLYGLPALLGTVVVVIFVAFAVVFVINGVQLIRSSSRLPLPTGEESKRRGRALQIGVRRHLRQRGRGHRPRMRPAGDQRCLRVLRTGDCAGGRPALHSVRLHFRRTIDFYIAAWVVIWAVLGIWLIASQILPAPLVASLVGVATACGTAAYGGYMLRVKRAILASASGA